MILLFEELKGFPYVLLCLLRAIAVPVSGRMLSSVVTSRPASLWLPAISEGITVT